MSLNGPRLPRLRLDAASYEKLRQQVLRRDAFKCQACGAMSTLEVHHQEFRSHSGRLGGKFDHCLFRLPRQITLLTGTRKGQITSIKNVCRSPCKLPLRCDSYHRQGLSLRGFCKSRRARELTCSKVGDGSPPSLFLPHSDDR